MLQRHSRHRCVLGPCHTGDSVAGDNSVNDSEYIASSEGFHTVDSLRKVSCRQNYCRPSSLVARRQGNLLETAEPRSCVWAGDKSPTTLSPVWKGLPALFARKFHRPATRRSTAMSCSAEQGCKWRTAWRHAHTPPRLSSSMSYGFTVQVGLYFNLRP